MSLTKKTSTHNIFYLYLLGLMLVVLSSYWRWSATGSFKVDNNPVENSQMYGIVLTFCLGLVLNIYAYIQLLFVHEIALEQIRKWAFVTVSLAVFMMPMLSNDSMLYLSYGNLLEKGLVTYVHPELITQSDYMPYVAQNWLDCPNHYGPFLLYIFGLVTSIGKTVLGSLFIYKIVVWICSMAIINLLNRFIKDRLSAGVNKEKVASFKKAFLLISLAPVFWIQGVGQGHVDLIITLLIVVFLGAIYKNKWLLAALMVALILLSKTLYAAVFIPFYLSYLTYSLWKEWGYILKNSSILILVVSLISISFYASVWEGTNTITTAISYHESKPPSRSHVEVLTDILFYSQKLLGTDDALSVDQIASADDGAHNDKTIYSKPISSVFKLLGFLLAGWVFLGVFFARKNKDLFHVFGKVLLVIFCFYSPIFHPWYFLLILPFFVFVKNKNWILYIAIVFSIANFHEIAFTIPKNSPFYLPTVLFVLMMVISFFWKFKTLFLQETYDLIKQKMKSQNITQNKRP